MLKSFSIIFIGVLLTACGGGDSTPDNGSGSSDTSSQIGLPNDLSGLVVFDSYRPARGPKGIFVLELNQGKIIKNKTITDGEFGRIPYAYDRDTIVYAEPCNGKYTHRVKTLTSSGLASPQITPCSSSIETRESIPGRDNAYLPIKVAKMSPDKSKIAVSFEVLIDMSTEGDLVIVYDANSGEELKRYPRYASPEWLPDGRLLITPYGDDTDDTGIYMSDVGFTKLSRVDSNQINTPIRDIDLSPSGNNLIFLMGSQVWRMNIDGSNLEEIIFDASIIHFPTWSPDEKYIAYLSFGSSFYHEKITFYDTVSGKSYIYSTENTFAPDTDGTSTIGPSGPLSWVY